MNKITVSFEAEKETKNTYKFKESVGGPLDTPKVGTIYVPKATLKEIGWMPGTALCVELSAQ